MADPEPIEPLGSPGPLPTPLNIPEISRFIHRANQLRKAEPIIAYWCECHAASQIIGKSLLNTTDECFAYTKAIIERLENTKRNTVEDAMVDDAAGQAYVEQFAQKTLSHAEQKLRDNELTKQTADLFNAAATDLALIQEWGPLDPEVLKKIKFAKWSALKILKAIRESDIRSKTNPKVEEEPLDTADPEVQQIMGEPATVEDAPDAGEPADAQEGYFPASAPFAPSPMSQSPGPQPAQPAPVSPVASPQVPLQPSPQIPTKLPSQFAPPPVASSQVPLQPSPQIPTKLPSQFAPPPEPTVPEDLPSRAAPPPESAAPVPPPTWGSAANLPSHPAPPSVPSAEVTHKDMEQAQKHARFAVSALNFDDVQTAIQELRNALAKLGTQ